MLNSESDKSRHATCLCTSEIGLSPGLTGRVWAVRLGSDDFFILYRTSIGLSDELTTTKFVVYEHAAIAKAQASKQTTNCHLKVDRSFIVLTKFNSRPWLSELTASRPAV